MTVCPAKLSPAIVAFSYVMDTTDSYAGNTALDAASPSCPTGAMINAALEKLKELPADEVDRKLLCGIMCCCRDSPAISAKTGQNGHQECVKQTLNSADKAMGWKSRYKAEVSYDMITDEVPQPLVHRDENGNDTTEPSGHWQTRAGQIQGYRRNRGHVRRPDVVIVKDPNRPPYQDNIEKVVEMKFDDPWNTEQQKAYEMIAGDPEKFVSMRDKTDCDCNNGGDPVPITSPAYEKQKDTADDTQKTINWGAVSTTAVMGLVTAVLAISTLALAVSPVDGPAGELAAGAATTWAGARTAAAFGSIF